MYWEVFWLCTFFPRGAAPSPQRCCRWREEWCPQVSEDWAQLAWADRYGLLQEKTPCSPEAFALCLHILHGTAEYTDDILILLPLCTWVLSSCDPKNWDAVGFWVLRRLEMCTILQVSGNCSFLIQVTGTQGKKLSFVQSAQCNLYFYQPSANSNPMPHCFGKRLIGAGFCSYYLFIILANKIQSSGFSLTVEVHRAAWLMISLDNFW